MEHGPSHVRLPDGQLEDLDAGLARLAAAAAARRTAPLDALVDGVLADLVDVAGAGDDIAVVAVRRADPARPGN